MIKKFFSFLKRYLINKKSIKFFFYSFLLAFLLTVIFQSFYTKNDPRHAKLERENINTKNNIVNEVTELHPVKVLGIIIPHTEEEIVEAVKNNDHISIGGGRNSMGGQTASERTVQIDMREYNKIISLSTTTKEVTVQTGLRWRDLQDYIDPFALSVKIMQTYSNFTVGGSLSVNVHGRYVGLGPIILSVKSIRVILADGSVVNASPTENSEIFYSAIGGYGGIGVITEATLQIADNTNVERSRIKMPTNEYGNYFKNVVKATSSKILFHNGDIYPKDFDSVSAVSWTETDKKVTTEDKLIPREHDYWLERFVWVTMSEWPLGKWLREYLIEPALYSGSQPVHSRNYEASYDIMELEPEKRASSTYVLQEYFVPVENFDTWIPKMKKVFIDNDVNILNVSIRHALPDPGSKLAWANKESFAFVVYYKQNTDEKSKQKVAKWTREMIDEVISVEGGYYLPYQPHATDEQFYKAYPKALEYFEIKNKYDPTDKFTNRLWDKYYSKEKLELLKEKKVLDDFVSINNVKDYEKKPDNTYLGIPEWYIVYSADEYASVLKNNLPSNFNYKQAVKDYWSQYDKVLESTASSTNNNQDYLSVLKVIGVSFTVENYIKYFYENTIGKLSEKVASNKKVSEDYFAADMNADYAKFIYDYPWYDFKYFNYLKKLWNLENIYEKQEYTFGQNIRSVERKLILSLELLIKSGYSKIISYVTHAKFGVQDDVIDAIISRDKKSILDKDKKLEIVNANHYHPFTKKLLQEMDSSIAASSNFEILEIAGNKKINFVYYDVTGSVAVESTKEILRDNQLGADMITVEIETKNIYEVYKNMKEKKLEILHFYDY